MQAGDTHRYRAKVTNSLGPKVALPPEGGSVLSIHKPLAISVPQFPQGEALSGFSWISDKAVKAAQ